MANRVPHLGVVPSQGAGAASEPGPVPVVPELHPERELPPEHRGNAALNNAAEKIGNFIGIAMNRIREFPAQARKAREQLGEAQRRATGQVGEAAGDLKRTTRLRATQARDRTQQFVHEKPIHAIGGAAGAAFALGFALRLWRWKNARRG